jgi:hypothetical protein
VHRINSPKGKSSLQSTTSGVTAPELLFDEKETLAALHALADLLATRTVEHQTLIIVGGSYLALNNLRESTCDID